MTRFPWRANEPTTCIGLCLSSFRSLEPPPRGTWRPPEARLGLVVYSGWSPYGVLWLPLGYIRDTILGDLGHVFLSTRPYPGSQTTL